MRAPSPEGRGHREPTTEKALIRQYLEHLEAKRQPQVGEIVTVLDGPYAHQGMKVKEVTADGNVFVLLDPESVEPIQFPASEVFAYRDYEDAFGFAWRRTHPGEAAPDDIPSEN